MTIGTSGILLTGGFDEIASLEGSMSEPELESVSESEMVLIAVVVGGGFLGKEVSM